MPDTITFRSRPEDAATITAIIAAESKPGLKITQSDAIRIALAEWMDRHTQGDNQNKEPR